MPTSPPSERRVAAVTIAAAVILFLVLRFLTPRAFETPDEAKYVGLGLNVLFGEGLVTVFGVPFANHSPVWALVLAAPEAWFGIDGIVVGQSLNALSAAALIAFAGMLGWRVRPAVGALAAISLLGFPYLFDLSRTAGIDLPAAALSLGYLVVGLRAVDRGSLPQAAVAGVLLGVAFLIKEIALPFVPIPFLAGLAWGRPWPRLARQAALTLLVATLILAWWFVLHASVTGVVYRLGAPAWLLGPLAVALAIAIVVGLSLEPLLARRGRIVPSANGGLRWAVVLAWVGGLGWAALQLVVYARTPKLGGAGLLRMSALTAYVEYVPTLAGALAFTVPGIVLTLVAAVSRRLDPVTRRELFPIGMAILANLPLVILVIALGETPRHYIAIVPLLAVAASIGWVRLAEGLGASERWARASLIIAVLLAAPFVLLAARRLLTGIRQAPITFVLIGLITIGVLALVMFVVGRRGMTRAWLPTMLIGVLLVGAAGVAGATAALPTVNDATKLEAVETASAWVRANVAPGTPVAVSRSFAYELGRRLTTDHEMTRVRPRPAVFDPTTLELRQPGSMDPLADPVVLTPALNNVDQFDVLRAVDLTRLIDTDRPGYWIHSTFGDERSPLTVLLESTPGVTREMSWTYPYRDTELNVAAYRIDPDAFAPDPGRMYVDPIALDRLIDRLEAAGPGVGEVADRYRERAMLTPPSTDDASLLARLDALHGR